MTPAAADCQPQNLSVVLSTGWDQTGGATIPPGNPDDDWDVTVDASAGTVPRDADVVTPNSAWLTLPNSEWIAADVDGPDGIYVYETCWCMDDDFTSPNLSFALRADDQADVYLNGNLLLSLPDGTFNDATALGMSVVNPAFFNVGPNCMEVVVENKYGVVTGFNLTGTMTATNGECCDCDERDIDDDCSTGYDELTSTLIPSGDDDDDWIVTAAASGGTLPRPAEVIDTFSGWNVIPGTKWISADENGPNGHYVYEKCWCMNGLFENAELDVELLADDRADVFLNGNLIGSTPATNAFLFPATAISTSDQSLFKEGENCVTIDVENVSSVVTGLNVSMNVTATNAECCPCTELPPDAEAWWPLNETSGIIAVDEVNAHDGTHMEATATAPPPTPAAGKVLGGLEFDGVDDYVEVPDDPGLNFGAGDDLSIDAWIRTDSPIRQAIVHKRTQGPGNPGFGFYTNPLLFEMWDGVNFQICLGSTALDDGEWHFVAVTVDRDDPNGIKMYVDGVLETVCDPTGVPGSLANTLPLFIGADPLAPGGGNVWWDGILDEIEIFRRALTTTEIEDLYVAGEDGKCPLPNACEDSTGDPVCLGECPPGFTCVTGPPPDEPCECIPDTDLCGGFGPECMGTCPNPDEICTDANGIDCTCEPMVPCEGWGSRGPWPECIALCPPGFVCVDNGQRCHCATDTPCELAEFPDCGGLCPSGVACEPDFVAMECVCDDPIELCEGLATYPECNGHCPEADQICINNGQRCHCEVPGTACEETFYPECGGGCPQGESCENIPGSDLCECVPDPQPCNDSQYPECNGTCPDPDDVCKQSPQQGCWCIGCGTGVPDPWVPILVHMDSDDKIRWTPIECALVYNLYRGDGQRLSDGNHDGLADDYGDCYIPDIIGTEVEDTDPTQSGILKWYLVTGENFTGEGSLGTNSGQQERQATTPCP